MTEVGACCDWLPEPPGVDGPLDPFWPDGERPPATVAGAAP